MKMDSESIGKKLNRSANSVRTRACLLKLPNKQNYWTEDEIQYLKKNYTKMSCEKIGRKLNRSATSVYIKARHLKLPRKQNYWTKDELDYLKNNYAKMNGKEIGRKLNRSADSIYEKVSQLELPKKQENWTEDDLIYLEYFVYMGDDCLQEAADFLNRTRDATALKLSDLRKKNKDVAYLSRKWTEADDNYVKANYRSLTYQAIALKLGRSRMAVATRVRRLGLRKIRSIVSLDLKIREMTGKGLYVADIARELEIDYDTLRKYLIKHNISYQPMSQKESLERARAKSPWHMYKFVIGKNRRKPNEKL